MLRKLACAVIAVAFSVSLVWAEEFGASIRKIDGDKISVIKGAKKDVKGEEVTLTLAKDVKVYKGKYNEDTKKMEKGDAIEDGLKDTVFSKINNEKGLGARITTNDDGKVTQIVVGGKKKKANQ